jgi:hypothetical protein
MEKLPASVDAMAITSQARCWSGGRARTDSAEIHDFTAPDFFRAIELNNPEC